MLTTVFKVFNKCLRLSLSVQTVLRAPKDVAPGACCLARSPRHSPPTAFTTAHFFPLAVLLFIQKLDFAINSSKYPPSPAPHALLRARQSVGTLQNEMQDSN